MAPIHITLPTDNPAVLSAYVKGRRTALLTAASAVNHAAIPTWRILADLSELCLLFSPEHGLSSALKEGDFGREEGSIHAPTGASLYDISATSHERLCDLLRRVDVAVYDIQDVGARFYTYLSNLTMLMRAARDAGVPVLVLDRPNPIANRLIEGPLLDEVHHSSFIGEYAIPVRYGLTVGEYARFVRDEKKIDCDLHVIPISGWTPDLYMDETDLLWVNPSPNIPTVSCAVNYIGSCIYEATNISEGRGTTHPFDYVGAPFVDAERLARDMTALSLGGVVFRPLDFVPTYSKHTGDVCHGVELHITDRSLYRPLETMLWMFKHFKTYPEFTCHREGLALRFGRDLLADEYDPTALCTLCREDPKRYCENVEKYRLYR